MSSRVSSNTPVPRSRITATSSRTSSQLASRLENDPNDLNGWLMLIRAYSVLGDKDKASAALGRARTVFANQTEAQAQLAQSAKEFSLN